MNTTTRALLLACMLVSPLVLTACKKEAPVADEAAEKKVLTAPGKDDDAGWKAYLPAVVQENMGTVTNNPFLYYLPPESDPEFAAKYERQVESAKTAMARGVQKGNLLAFGSPASAKMADLMLVAFADVPPDTLKGVKVLFIGKAEDSERVKAAVTPSGVNYVFVETK